MHYDIIGDVHGHSAKLERLLFNLGYRESGGCWRHPDAMAVFVGDLVDRGPGQLETLGIVERMVGEGAAKAVMGNHELNAIAWMQESQARPGDTMRQRQGHKGANNLKQHKAFLDQVGEGSSRHLAWIEWFKKLPLWLELDGVCVTHACWHPGSIDLLKAQFGSAVIPESMLARAIDEPASDPGDGSVDEVFAAVELICKGMEAKLPNGAKWVDPAGYQRSKARTRWWDSSADTFRQASIVPSDVLESLPDEKLPQGFALPEPGCPVVFGHYWFTGTPSPLGPKHACVDYSAGKDGDLVAYRFRGERSLDAGRFLSSAS